MSREWAKATLAVTILTAMTWAALQTASWRAAAAPIESVPRVSQALFDQWVLPFEVLSVLLLGALIAALYVGAKHRREPGAGGQ